MIIQSDEAVDLPVPAASGDPGTPGAMRLHLFRPAVPGRHPGILFFSEIYQVTDPIRRLAAFVAGQGYLVAVPEVYHGYEPPRHGAALRRPRHRARQRAQGHQAGRIVRRRRGRGTRLPALASGLHRPARHARRLPGRPPGLSRGARPLGLGRLLLLPDRHPLGNAGRRPVRRQPRTHGSAKAETLWVFGRQDPHVPFAGRQAIRERLEQVGARYEWHEVNAAHAFLRDEGPRYDPALFRQADRLDAGVVRARAQGDGRLDPFALASGSRSSLLFKRASLSDRSTRFDRMML